MNQKRFVICVQISTPSQAIRIKGNITTFIASEMVEVIDNVYVIKARNPNITCESIRATLSTFMNDCAIFVMETSQHAAWRVAANIDAKLNAIL